MPTREESFIELREFEKKRKRDFLAKPSISSLIIAIILAILSFQYLGYQAILYSICLYILSFFLVVLITPIVKGEWDYSIKKIKANFSQEIQKAKKLEEYYKHYLIHKKEKAEISQKFVSKLKESTKNIRWPNYVFVLAEMDMEKVRKIEKEIENIQNQICECEVKLEFYDKIPEKTYFQYLWSFKWLKKIN